jgi:hypothetical protein
MITPHCPTVAIPLWSALHHRLAGALAAVALTAAGALAQASVLESAQILPGALTSGEAAGVQWEPCLAAGGPGALMVWLDERASFHSPLANQGGGEVFAVRVDPDGRPLDPHALRLPHEIGNKWAPRVAWNGTAWLVVWENHQPLSSSHYFRRILAVRISANGQLLDHAPIVVKDDFDTVGGTTAVASDGTDWTVVSQGSAMSPSGIVATRVSAGGAVVNPGGTQVLDVFSTAGSPDLEFANGRYLLAYASGSVKGLLFDQTYSAIGAEFGIGTGSGGKPHIATDGVDFLVVAQANQGLGTFVQARRVTAATGGVSQILLVTPDTNADYNWDPDVAWSQGQWMVACRNSVDQSYRIARISSQLAVLDFGGVVMPFGAASTLGACRLAPSTGGVTAVFERSSGGSYPGEVHGAGVTGQLVATSTHVVSRSVPRQAFPALAMSPTGALTAFASDHDGKITIAVQRLGRDGRAIDTEPTPLAVGSRFGRPSVAWNGSVYLVVWEDLVVVSFETDDRVLGMRVGPDGRAIDRAPFVVMDGNAPDVAARGGEFLVVASQAITTQLRYPFAQRIDGNGQPIGSPAQVSGSFSRHPRVAPLDSGWVVTWQRSASHDSAYSFVQAALIDVNGSVAPSFTVAGSAAFGGAARPDVAATGDTALLVWQDDTLGLGARRVQGSGVVQASFAIASSPAIPGMPSVAWTGSHWFVAWEEYRNRVGLWDRRLDVFAARVDANGTVLDPAGGLPIADGYETESMPAVAGRDGDALVAISQFVPRRPWATLRVAVRRHAPLWAELGHGLAGSAGVPSFVGSGTWTPADPGTLTLTNALPNSLALVALGLTRIDLPLFGGTLVPHFHAPFGFVVDAPTLAVGSLVLTLPSSPSLGGADFFAQAWILDPAGPAGFSASNAVRGRLP